MRSKPKKIGLEYVSFIPDAERIDDQEETSEFKRLAISIIDSFTILSIGKVAPAWLGKTLRGHL